MSLFHIHPCIFFKTGGATAPHLTNFSKACYYLWPGTIVVVASFGLGGIGNQRVWRNHRCRHSLFLESEHENELNSIYRCHESKQNDWEENDVISRFACFWKINDMSQFSKHSWNVLGKKKDRKTNNTVKMHRNVLTEKVLGPKAPVCTPSRRYLRNWRAWNLKSSRPFPHF